jgi:hypothetical protein
MVEFQVSGNFYRASKLDVFGQGNLARKLAPLVPKSVPAIKAFAALKAKADAELAAKVAAGDESAAKMSVSDILDSLDSFSPLADALAQLSDDAFRQILVLCVSVVQRQQGTSWAAVARGETMMFDDMDFGVLVPIMSQVIRLNLGNFISGLLSAPSPATSPAPQTAG